MITPEQFIADFPMEIQQIVQQLRTIVKQAITNVIEAVYPGWRLIGYKVKHGKRKIYFCFIAPKHDRVLLGFEYGVLMADPYHLLDSGGKQVRQVTIEHASEIDLDKFDNLLQEGARVALLKKAQKA